MKQKVKFSTKIIAFVLSVLMVVVSLPMYAFASSFEEEQATEESSISKSELAVLEEDESLREENVKHFKLSDGTSKAVIYPSAVHYLDENGKWIDINNALTLNGSEYASSNKFEIKFANKSGGGKLVSIKDGGYKIDFTPVNASKSNVVIENPQSNNSRKFEDVKNLKNIVSKATYADIYSGVELQYILVGSNIKENIIVKERLNSYSFDFEIQLNGLEAKLENGSIVFLDIDTKEEKYIIPAPYMYDANGNYSKDVEYTFVQNNKWKYTLTVTASTEWINSEDRAFPITIDPTIIPPADSIMDTYTGDEGMFWDNSSYETFFVGNHPYQVDSRAYLKVVTLPTIPQGAVLTDAKLALYSQSSITADDFQIGAFKITDSWVDSTIEYNSNPNYLTETNPVDYVKMGNSGVYTWNITEIAKDWYSGEANHGVCLKPVQQSATSNVFAIFASSEAVNLEPPYFEITYVDTKGIEGYFSYYTSSAGMAGAGYINSFTGNLSFIHNIFTTADEIMPYSLFLAYNSQMGAWDLSTNETVCATEQEYLYKWIDSDGTVHWFSPEKEKNAFGGYVYYEYLEDGSKYYASTPPSVFYDEDGLGLNLRPNTADGTFEMSDDSGNKKVFDSQGRLSAITDTYGNVRAFNRDSSGRLTSIALTPKNLSSIEQITVSYATDSITVTNKQTGVIVTVNYLNNTVQSVEYTYPDLDGDGNGSTYKSSFTYDSEGKLIFAKDDESKKAISYAYSDGKITLIKEVVYDSDNAEKLGNQASISYADMQTTYRTSGSDNINGSSDDILTVYVFDYKGRVITAYTCDANSQTVYGASNYTYNDKYTDENVGAKKNNSIKSVLQTGKNSVNLLKNPSFEVDTSGWTVSGGGSVYPRDAIYSSELGIDYGVSLSMARSSAGTTKVQQALNLTAGDYNFSLSLAKVNLQEGGSVSLKVYNSSGAEIATTQPNTVYSVSDTILNMSWEKEALSFNAPTDGSYTVSIEYTTNSTTQKIIYLDDVMLEKCKGLGTFSAYENGEFNQAVASSNLFNASVVSGAGMLGSNGVKLDSTVTTDSYVKYTYNVYAGFEPENWVVSAWAKAPDSIASANTDNNSAKFGIRIVAHYTGISETEEIFIPFNAETKEWQYTCARLMVSPDNYIISTTVGGGRLETIDVYLCYEKNIGSAYFDSVSINRAGSYVSYSYNDFGNLTSTGNSNGDTTAYEYANNATDVSGATDSIGNQYSFEYDGSHNLTGAVYGGAGEEFAERARVDYQYNDQGQIIKSTASAKNLSKNIITSVAYITDTTKAYYSQAQITTDELGNKTEYLYYSNGLLKGICDDSGNGILYEYNDYGELVCAKLAEINDTGALVELSTKPTDVEYSYNSKHELSGITSQSTKYAFKYDEWGNTVGIYIDNPSTADTEYDKALATYSYEDGFGNLSRITYGNGAYVDYIYDELDRMVGVCYNGIRKSEYVYASSGQISSVVDIENNTTYQYYYDGDGKLINERTIRNNITELNVFYKYDDNDRIYQKWSYFPTSEDVPTSVITYSYNEDGSISSIQNNNGTESYTYDDFGRVSSNALSAGSSLMNDTYSYLNIGTTDTTNYIDSVTSTVGSSEMYNTHYTYDERGNITAIQYRNLMVASDPYYVYYQYDAIGQLVREDNQLLGYTYIYAYDDSGNMVYKETRSYTTLPTESISSTQPLSCENFGRTDDGLLWHDRRKSYYFSDFVEPKSGTTTYDEIGNPLTYFNGSNYTFTWQNGRELASATKGSNTTTYEYNQDGIRIVKRALGSRYEYTLNGTQIVRECEYLDSTNKLYADRRYFYDANGIISSAKVYYYGYNGTTATEYDFYFRTNIQGDVLAVYNAEGTAVMEITYDAWGNFTDTVSNMSYPPSTEQLQALAMPFRYRGYYYDQDTGLYYLNTRYYDAKMHRFINADSYVSTGQGLTGANMYAYCNNNPVMFKDSSGERAIKSVPMLPLGPVFYERSSTIVTCLFFREAHYSRNELNMNCPNEETEFLKEGGDKWDDSVSANCHQFTAENRDNKKYVSPDGKHEVIYDSEGKMVTDPRDMGTYNFIPVQESYIGHFFADVLPWVFYGNSEDDTTTIWERICSFVGIY